MRLTLHTVVVLFVFSICTCAYASSSAVVVCVSDETCSTGSSPFKSIAEGIAEAVETGSDRVIVNSGHYNEEASLNISSPNMTIQIDGFVTVRTIEQLWFSYNGSLSIEGGSLILIDATFVIGTGGTLSTTCSLLFDFSANSTGQFGALMELEGTWNQGASVSFIVVQSTGRGVLVKGGNWNMRASSSCYFNITSREFVAVQISSGGVWEQDGGAVFELIGGSETTGISCQGSSWNQHQSVEIISQGASNGVSLRSQSHWLCNAWLTIVGSFSKGAVELDSSTWIQQGVVTFNISTGTGVRMASPTAEWTQNGPLTCYVGGTCAVVQGIWTQNEETLFTVSGSGLGAEIQSSGQWYLNKMTHMNILSGTGIVLIGYLRQSAPIVANVSGIGFNIATTFNLDLSVGSSTNFTLLAPPAVAFYCQDSNFRNCCDLARNTTHIFINDDNGQRSNCLSSSATPSPSALVVAPVTLNVTAAFDPQRPTVALTGSITTTGGSSQPKKFGVEVGLGSLQLGNDTTIDVASLDITADVQNVTNDGDDSDAYTTTHTYTASGIDLEGGGAARLVQSFTYLAEASHRSFAGVNFTTNAASVKWSLTFTITNATTTTNTTASKSEGFIVRYRVTSIASSSPSSALGVRVHKREGVPVEGMTTFFISLPGTSSAVAQVELLNVALVDGIATPLTSIDLISFAHAAPAYYELALGFPACDESVEYDPSVGLGVLLGSKRGGSSSGGSDTGLVVGVSVGVGLAVLTVAVVIGVAVGWSVWRSRFGANRLGTINFDAGVASLDDEDHL